MPARLCSSILFLAVLAVPGVQNASPPPDAAPAPWRLLEQLVGGQWVHENQRPDGGLFLSRSVVERGPGGKSLIARGWLGSADGMFEHASTQIWLEPATGEVSFLSLNQQGSIARGPITAPDDHTLIWTWTETGPKGDITPYGVRMTFENADAYRFRLTRPRPDGTSEEAVNVLYNRVKTPDAKFLKLREPAPAPIAPSSGAPAVVDPSKFVASGTIPRGLEKEVIVGAAPDEVFRAWTTAEGLKSFLGVESRVELRVGGPFEIYFSSDAPTGQRGSEGCQVLSYVTGRVFSFSWNAPPKFPDERERRTWVVLTMDEQGNGRTRVRLTHTGFGEGGRWPDVRNYFDLAWGRVLDALRERYP